MNKRIKSGLLALIMSVSMLVSATPVYAAPSESTDAGLIVSETDLHPGESVTVTLKVPAITEKISDASWKVKFDKTAFEATSVNAPTITGCTHMASNASDANNNGFFSVGYRSSSFEADVAFSGAEFSATFKVKEDATLKNYTFDVVDSDLGTLDEYGGPVDVSPTVKVNSVIVTITPKPVAVTGVSLNKTALALNAGASETLTAEVAPDNATKKTVTWTSNNVDVATVSDGVVTAVAEGTATITVTTVDGSKTATCEVIVNKAPCTHTNLTKHDAYPAADCRERSCDAYWTCDDCTKMFSDATATTEISAIPYTTYGAHVWKDTYSSDESNHYHVCQYHSDVKDSVVSHSGGTATCTAKATCTTCGREYGDLNSANHTGTATKIVPNNNGTHDVLWTCCDAIENDDVACSGGTATCTAKATCTTCGQEYGEKALNNHASSGEKYVANDADTHKKLHDCCDSVITASEAHNWGDDEICDLCGYDKTHHHGNGTPVEATSANCATETNGSEAYYLCSCGAKFAEAECTNPVTDAELVIAWAHDLEHHSAVAETCCADGTIEYWECTSCGKKFSDAGITVVTNIVTSKTGVHTGTAWNYNGTDHWHECTVGGTEFGKENHTYENEADMICDTCGYDRTIIYTVTFDANGHGTAPEQINDVKSGEKVSEPAAPVASGYSFGGWYKENGCTNKWDFNTDTITDNITLYAKWTKNSSSGGGGGGSYTPSTYSITVETSKHGDVTVSKKNASKGDTVTLTVDPDKGYTLETITVTDKNGKEIELTKKNGKYTFTMPASKVTIEATFMEDNTMLNYFVDVAPDAYYYDAVLWAAEKGITSGTDAVHFSPNASCSRAQVVTFLWRAAGSPVVNYALPFTDVPTDSYYADAVRWAVSEGITSGTSATTFGSNATCNRAQIVTLLYRANGLDTLNIKDNPFTDVTMGSYYYDAVLWAAENGITGGTSANAFSPSADCTRAQIVTFLYRYMGK